MSDDTTETVTPAPVTPEKTAVENPDPAIPATSTSATPDLPDPRSGREYRKTATVWAVQLQQRIEVPTLEGILTGQAGDYLCQGPNGERWPVRQEIFEGTYVPVEPVPGKP
jgi:hypothetical protein